ncbi:MAG TPA: YicC/YloC family endoribonuclease [bacterium]|nr:YicC/YloC family endoribonuclease [bacterium]
MYSMTGFGVAQGKVGRFRLVVEARSVNHRFCEVSFRSPGRFAIFDPEVARRVRERFARGKFELFLREESVDREQAEIELAKRSYRVLKRLQKEVGISGPVSISDILTCRGILFAHAGSEDIEALRKPLMALVDRALDSLRTMRSREGLRLRKWFEGRARHLFKLLQVIEKEALKRGDSYRRKLEERYKGPGTMEEGRVLQETAIMAERADVTEEIVRLRSHLHEFERFTRLSEPIGRKFDFLAQEMGREINTIGSKSQGVKLAHQVIEFKSELERIREQIQNVE